MAIPAPGEVGERVKVKKDELKKSKEKRPEKTQLLTRQIL